MSGREGVLLVVGIGSQKDRDSRPYREHLLAGAARVCPLWLLETDELTWQAPYAAGSTVLSGRTADDLVAAARQVAAERDVIGVLAPDEGLLLPSAHLIAALGVPGASVEAVSACRDKKLSRRLMTDAGLPQPWHTSVTSAEELRAVGDEFGYPLVLKPRSMGASSGVIKVTGPEETDEAYRITVAASTYPGIQLYPDIVVEEFLDGPEISVDGSVVDGVFTAHIVARKKIGQPPFFIETGHIVSPDDPYLRDPDITDLLQRAHKALGFHHGMTHSEIKFTPRGPVVIEINGRPGGDLIPKLGWLAGGVDLGRIAAEVALGELPTRSAAGHGDPRAVGIRFCCPTEPTTMAGVRLPSAADHPHLLEAEPLALPGALLQPPPGDYVSRYAYLIAEGGDQDEVASRLDALEQEVVLEGEPAESPS